MMGWSSLARWVSRRLALVKRQLAQPKETVGNSGDPSGGVSGEALYEPLEMRKVALRKVRYHPKLARPSLKGGDVQRASCIPSFCSIRSRRKPPDIPAVP